MTVVALLEGALVRLLVAILALGVERLLRGEVLPLGLVAVALPALLLGPGLVLVVAGSAILAVLRAFRTMGLSGAAAKPGPAAKTIATINAVQNATFLIGYLLGWCSGDHKFVFTDYQQKLHGPGFLNTNLTLPSPPLEVQLLQCPGTLKKRTTSPGGKEMKYISRASGIFLTAIALSLAVVSVASAEPLMMNGAGATFPYPLYSKWFYEYSNANPGVKFNYQSIGSGGGIKQITAGTVDFGASDAPMTEEEMGKLPGAILHLPTASAPWSSCTISIRSRPD
jgi:hypothetical protein